MNSRKSTTRFCGRYLRNIEEKKKKLCKTPFEKTFSFLHFPPFVKIITLILHKHPRSRRKPSTFPFSSQPLFLSFLFFLSVSSYQNNPIQKLAPPRKKIHPQKQSTYVTNHPSNAPRGEEQEDLPSLSLSLSLSPRSACSRKESGAKRKRDRLKIHGRL